MNTLATLAAALVVTAAPAFAQYSYDAATGTCRDAAGQEGLNTGVRGPCADLRGAQLDGANLQGLDLRGARLDGAHLSGASLFRADLRGARLDGADLSRGVLTGAKLNAASLVGARLVGAHLEHATLEHATLTGTDLRNACLFHTSFVGADLRTATFSQTRALLGGAHFAHAKVAPQTLPFGLDELAAQQVEVTAVAANP